mmetsp:Transcript_31461/g.52848  ORF Transcript_31461/g.52848 Transcript_31461/m.52848 type:complete len:210 (-) Transcript_31461:213-842(-)
MCNAVWPPLFCLFTSEPALIRSALISVWPFWAAMWMAVLPFPGSGSFTAPGSFLSISATSSRLSQRMSECKSLHRYFTRLIAVNDDAHLEALGAGGVSTTAAAGVSSAAAAGVSTLAAAGVSSEAAAGVSTAAGVSCSAAGDFLDPHLDNLAGTALDANMGALGAAGVSTTVGVSPESAAGISPEAAAGVSIEAATGGDSADMSSTSLA